MADKRITELTNEKLTLGDGDYTIIDSNEGTYKFKLKRILDAIPAPDTTLSIAGRAADAAKTGEELTDVKRDLNDKANMTVGSSRQLLSEKYLLDEEPYLFRASGGDGSDRVEECIVGGSVAWNQLMPSLPSKTENGITGTSNADGTYTLNGTATGAFEAYTNAYTIAGHKYLFCGIPEGCSDSTYYAYAVRSRKYSNFIHNETTSGARSYSIIVLSGATVTNLKVNLMVFDLTRMFGSTIADYIYSLEQATAGAGVAWFKKYFPEDYYPYSAPTLRHVEGMSQKEVVGWNQWDEEWEVGGITLGSNSVYDDRIRSKNYIAILPNTIYFFNIPSTYTGNVWVSYYDANKEYIAGYNVNGTIAISKNANNTTPNNAYFMRFQIISTATYNHDICISLSDPTKNGVYEPYHKNIYPLDSSLTLRGIPKLTDGKMYFDGDKYNADGSVARNTILRAYQSGDESLANAITDGTNTVVYSANASTETATPYTALQTLDPHGTEKFVTTCIVPVGHYSKYLENLRSKIEGLPKDFSTLIAPTEKEYKATQNYTVGSLLIVDNVLYKVTSAIANGGNITPNTNVTATTLAAVIAAL